MRIEIFYYSVVCYNHCCRETGHGGSHAAQFAKEHLINLIVNQKEFWSDDDEDVLRAIKEGYIATHYAMWREQGINRFSIHLHSSNAFLLCVLSEALVHRKFMVVFHFERSACAEVSLEMSN